MAALAEEGAETASPIAGEASFELEQPLAPKPFTPQELNYA